MSGLRETLEAATPRWKFQFTPRYWKVITRGTWGFTQADGAHRVLMHILQFGPFRFTKWMGPT